MSLRPSIIILALLACIILTPFSAMATTSVPVGEEGMLRTADAVVTGRIVDQWSSWDAARKFILTFSRMEVDEAVTGPYTSTSLVVQQAGGKVGDLGQSVHGVTLLRPQDEVLLFLKAKPTSGVHTIVGADEGHYKIRTIDGTKMAIPHRGHTIERGSQASHGSHAKVNSHKSATPLSDMINDLRAHKQRLTTPD